MMAQKFQIALQGCAVLLFLLLAASPVYSGNKIVGPKQCSDSNCHQSIFDKLLNHPHETFFNEKYEEEGQKIADKMQVADHFEDEKCIRCHGTEVASNYEKLTEEEKGLFGVICETCHNPAEEWIEVHDKKGKISEAVDKGMRPTRDLYQWSIDCFNCHRGVGEDYFKAGHKIGDKFELIRYSQGDFKHWAWSKKDKEEGNLDKKTTRKIGKIWIADKAFQVQFAIERLAEASPGSEFFKKNQAILNQCHQDLKTIQNALPSANLEGLITVTGKVAADPGLAGSVTEEVKQAVKTYIEEIDKQNLTAAQLSVFPFPEEKDYVRIKKD